MARNLLRDGTSGACDGGAKLSELVHSCVQEGEAKGSGEGEGEGEGKVYCVFSLAEGALTVDPSKEEAEPFVSRDRAQELCREAVGSTADLAIPSTAVRNRAAHQVVSAVGAPHWLGGNDQPNGHVTWFDGARDMQPQKAGEGVKVWAH